MTSETVKMPKIREDSETGRKYVRVDGKRIWLGKNVKPKDLVKFLLRKRKKNQKKKAKKATKKAAKHAKKPAVAVDLIPRAMGENVGRSFSSPAQPVVVTVSNPPAAPQAVNNSNDQRVAEVKKELSEMKALMAPVAMINQVPYNAQQAQQIQGYNNHVAKQVNKSEVAKQAAEAAAIQAQADAIKAQEKERIAQENERKARHKEKKEEIKRKIAQKELEKREADQRLVVIAKKEMDFRAKRMQSKNQTIHKKKATAAGLTKRYVDLSGHPYASMDKSIKHAVEFIGKSNDPKAEKVFPLIKGEYAKLAGIDRELEVLKNELVSEREISRSASSAGPNETPSAPLKYAGITRAPVVLKNLMDDDPNNGFSFTVEDVTHQKAPDETYKRTNLPAESLEEYQDTYLGETPNELVVDETDDNRKIDKRNAALDRWVKFDKHLREKQQMIEDQIQAREEIRNYIRKQALASNEASSSSSSLPLAPTVGMQTRSRTKELESLQEQQAALDARLKNEIDTIYAHGEQYIRGKQLNPEDFNIHNEFINRVINETKARHADEVNQLYQPSPAVDEEAKESQQGDGSKVNNDDPGLSTNEINHIMKGYPLYLGCIARNEVNTLPIKPQSRFGFVMNTDPNTKAGVHWVAIYVDATAGGDHSLDYYNSLADQPTPSIIKSINQVIQKVNPVINLTFKVNKIADQSEDSSNCGYFACKFLINRFKGQSFAKASGYKQQYPVGEANIEKWKKELGIEPFEFFEDGGLHRALSRKPIVEHRRGRGGRR